MIHFNDYIKSVRARGQSYFTNKQALSDLQVSPNALKCGMYKLKRKGDIISPAKGLYIIVPPEYQSIGSLPPDELIPIIMKHWNLDYYVCLLSAAVYFGASHQKPQAFQVMVNKQLKPLVCGKVKIDFIYKKSFKKVATQDVIVKSGYLKIALPEMIVMDMFLYRHRAGGLNHIATVLTELVEMLDPQKLMDVIINSQEKSWIQRFGYTLEKIDPIEIERRDALVKALKSYLIKKSLGFVLLAPELPSKKCSRNDEWKIIENSTIESDL